MVSELYANLYVLLESRLRNVQRMKWDWRFSVMPYGSLWRDHRRLFYQEFTGKAAEQHHSHQSSGVHDLLRHLLDTPEAWYEHLRQYVILL